jgi:hypothetical protein
VKLTKERVYRKNPDADTDRLNRIVAKCNWFTGSGERIPVCIGHTEQNLKECSACCGSKQSSPGVKCKTCDGQGVVDQRVDFLPVDVGSLSNFSTDGEWIFADMDIDDAFGDAVKRHRGKSAEIWSDDLLFPLSLLAHNRPNLMLGPVKYQREGERTTYNLPEEDDMGLSEEATRNLISECILSSELSAEIRTLTESIGQMQVQMAAHAEQATALKWLFDEEEEAEEMQAEEAEEEVAAADDDQPDGVGDAVPEVAEEEDSTVDEPDVEKNDIGMAMPSGTNTFVPSTEIGAKPDDEKKPKKKNYEELELESQTYLLEAENNKRLAADYAARIEALGGDAAAINSRVVELERKYAMERRRNELLTLHDQYAFDVDKEMEIVQAMDDGQFEQHKKLVVVKYAAPPVHSAPINVGELPQEPNDAEKAIPREVILKVAKYCHENKDKNGKHLDFEAGYRAMFGKGSRD